MSNEGSLNDLWTVCIIALVVSNNVVWGNLFHIVLHEHRRSTFVLSIANTLLPLNGLSLL
jgi:hypothetical protein